VGIATAAVAGTGPEGRTVGRVGAALAAAAVLAGPVAAAGTGPEVEIHVSAGGFEPAEVTARMGETTRIVLTSEDGEHCFAVDDLRVEKRVVAGHPTAFDLVPLRAGRFPFYCCLETGEAAERERGVIVVIE
jgi:heme/copper-type cytochrome/quinol oxidase subunit 2